MIISIHTDIHWISICVRNLIENALSHGIPPICLKLSKIGNNSLQIDISDQGICKFKNLSEMTAAFAKGNKSKGTGLGLNIVSLVIKEIGGKLSFKNNPTTFYYIDKGYKMNKLLIIEDDENLGPSLKTFFTDEKYNVQLVCNLDEASKRKYERLRYYYFGLDATRWKWN